MTVLIPFTTGNPFLRTKLLGVSTGRGSGGPNAVILGAWGYPLRLVFYVFVMAFSGAICRRFTIFYRHRYMISALLRGAIRYRISRQPSKRQAVSYEYGPSSTCIRMRYLVRGTYFIKVSKLSYALCINFKSMKT